MNKKYLLRSLKNERGIALIEAMVAALLLSLSIIAFVSLQAAMNRNDKQTRLHGEASFLASQLIGMMWTDQANLGRYAATAAGCNANAFAPCVNWYGSVQQNLPTSNATVNINGRIATITLTWAVPGEAPGRYQVQARIGS